MRETVRGTLARQPGSAGIADTRVLHLPYPSRWDQKLIAELGDKAEDFRLGEHDDGGGMDDRAMNQAENSCNFSVQPGRKNRLYH